MKANSWEEKLANSKNYSFFEIRVDHLSGPPKDYRLMAWHFDVGAEVKLGDIVATVETERSTMEIEALEHGILAERFFQVGDKIPDGAMIARLDPIDKQSGR